MLNAAVEDYFDEVIDVSFQRMHVERRVGVPTVKLDCEFAAPSRLGDELDFLIEVESVGKSSANLKFDVRCDGEARFRAAVVLVCMNIGDGRPMPWPDDIRPS
jgi:4-hydroxybenzoyl-CoA thioesterase